MISWWELDNPWVAMVLVLAVTWLAAHVARWIAMRAAGMETLERWLWRAGLLPQLLPRSFVRYQVWIANAVFALVLGVGLVMAARVADQRRVAEWAWALFARMPAALGVVALALATWWLGRYAGRNALLRLANEGVEGAWHWSMAVRAAVWATGLALVCETTGFARDLIRPAYLILLAGVTGVLAYAVAPWARRSLARLWEHDGAGLPGQNLLR